MADPDKPVREYVHGEQVQEGVNLHGHDPMLAATSVLFSDGNHRYFRQHIAPNGVSL